MLTSVFPAERLSVASWPWPACHMKRESRLKLF